MPAGARRSRACDGVRSSRRRLYRPCRLRRSIRAARAVGLVSETWAPGVGRFEDPGLLIDFSETPGAVPRGPCLCGEHTRELLREHGYSDDEIDALVADGAVLDAPVDSSGA